MLCSIKTLVTGTSQVPQTCNECFRSMYRVNVPTPKMMPNISKNCAQQFSNGNDAFNQDLCAWGSYYDSLIANHQLIFYRMFSGSDSCTEVGETPQSSVGPWCSCTNTGLHSLPNIAWFKSGEFDLVNMIWPNTAPGSAHAAASLNGPGFSRLTNQFGQHGARNQFAVLTGTKSGGPSQVEFGNILKSQFTICSVSRYVEGGAMERILTGGGENWLHGHWGGRAGRGYYGDSTGWVAHADLSPNTDWISMCGTNAGSQLILVNGISEGTSTGGSAPQTLWINGGDRPEWSDFAVVEVMAWDRGLSSDEIYSASNYLANKFGVGTVTGVSSAAPTSKPIEVGWLLCCLSFYSSMCINVLRSLRRAVLRHCPQAQLQVHLLHLLHL